MQYTRVEISLDYTYTIINFNVLAKPSATFWGHYDLAIVVF